MAMFAIKNIIFKIKHENLQFHSLQAQYGGQVGVEDAPSHL